MIYKTVNGDQWKKATIKKLISFCDKCPVLLSTQTGINEGQDGIFIIHQNTGTKYFYAWDFDLDPKVFIHNIKQDLMINHYPRLIEDVYEAHELTPEELAQKVEKGADFDSLTKGELRLVKKRYWIIDKVIAWKDIFILQEVDPKTGTLIGNQFRYKYNLMAITFMNDYRNGVFKTLEEAGKEFFSNSVLVNEIERKD